MFFFSCLQDLWYTKTATHFGTYENPVIIPSYESTRIVGCRGGKGNPGDPPEHELRWFEIEEGNMDECDVCGQVVILKKVPDIFPRYDGEGEHH